MGYFAVLAAAGTPKTDLPHVARCHLNLWALPGMFPGRRLLYLDVGVEIAAGASAVDAIQLLLPFRLEPGTWPDSSEVLQDLFDAVTDQTSAELIFGGPVKMTRCQDTYRLQVGDYAEEMRVSRVKPTAAKLVEDHAVRQDSSLVEVVLQDPVTPGKRAYFRVRLRVFGAPPLWRSTRVSGSAEVDFRICDVRESKFVDTERHLRERILDIDEANIFLMAPSKLIAEARSPELKYLRTLETGAWKRYLVGTAHRGSGGGLLVYYWQHKRVPQDENDPTSRSKSPINADNPFRVLLSLQRPASRVWWLTVLQVVLGVLLATVLIRLVEDVDLGSMRPEHLDFSTVVQFLLGTTLLAVIAFFERLRSWAAGRFLQPRSLLRRIERALLSIRLG